MQSIDLTHPIQTDMPVYPGDQPVRVTQTHTVHEHGFSQTICTLGVHAGTHIDVAAHVFENSPYLEQLGPQHFIGWGKVVDCTQLATPRIEKDVLVHLSHEDHLDFILFHTGWERHWQTDRYFQQYPTLSTAACHTLTQLGIKGIGLDTPSPDPIEDQTLAAHHLLLSHGISLVENLCNLQALPQTDFLFSCLPLPIKGAEASPVRAIGILAQPNMV